MKSICDIAVALQCSFCCPGVSSKRYFWGGEDEMETNFNEKWLQKWLHRRNLNQHCCLASLLHPLNKLVISWLEKKHKELEDRTAPIKQSYNPSQHPLFIWGKCWFGVIWSRFRCYHGALMMLSLQTSPVGYSAAACKGLGFALTGDLFAVNLPIPCCSLSCRLNLTPKQMTHMKRWQPTVSDDLLNMVLKS